MAGRQSSRSLGIASLIVAAATAAGCQADRSPRRVPDDGAPCSAVMPGGPKRAESTFRLDSVVVTERAWRLLPEANGGAPKETTRYFVRRVTVPAGAPLRDGALLDSAAARVARGTALQNETKPTVEKVTTAAGAVVDVRWTTGPLRSATRLLLIPGGYCEVTIMGARTEAEVASYLASARVQGRR
jgi:hypothetical protein